MVSFSRLWMLVGLLCMASACTPAESSTSATAADSTTISPEPPKNSTVQEPNLSQQRLYIAVPSGLNMRQSASSDSEVLGLVPYSAEVKVFSDQASGPLMVVEGIEGKMIPVEHDGKDGFVFSGFLASIPPPTGDIKDRYDYLQDYVGELKKSGYTAEYEDVSSEALRLKLTIPEPSLSSAFLIARKLFAIPRTYHLPTPGNQVTYSTPEKRNVAMQNSPYDYLTQRINRDANDTRITYYDDNEVGGREIVLKRGVVSTAVELKEWAH